MGVASKEVWKEGHIKVCHSHYALCGCIFADNAIDGMEDMFVWEKSDCGVDKWKNSLLVKLINQTMKTMPKKEDSKIMNVIGVNEKKEMFKSGVDVEHCWVSKMKEMLWIFVAEMGRGGCPRCTGFSPTFWARMLKFQSWVSSYPTQFIFFLVVRQHDTTSCCRTMDLMFVVEEGEIWKRVVVILKYCYIYVL